MYRVEFTSEAEDDLSRLNKPVAQRVLKKIRWLAENFEAITPEPLTGDLKGFYKLRVGDYRVFYTFGPDELIIHLVQHRREVYKNR